MTIEVAKNVLTQIKQLILSDKSWLKSTHEPIEQCFDMAIKSLEAWEKIKDQLSELAHHNLDVKENFEIGSTSRIECGTTASVLAEVIYLIDKHLSEVSE